MAVKAAATPFILLDDQTVSAALSYADDAGNPVPAPVAANPPTWASVDPDGTITVTPAADGNSAVIAATGKLTVTQAAQVTVTAGALSGSVQIQVNASAAASVVVGLGTPAHS
jgi:hypothetical protein